MNAKQALELAPGIIAQRSSISQGEKEALILLYNHAFEYGYIEEHECENMFFVVRFIISDRYKMDGIERDGFEYFLELINKVFVST